MDFLRLFPSESNGLQLLQVAVESAGTAEKIYSLNSNNPVSGYAVKKLLKSPIMINSTVDINIPLDKVKRIILIFNQGTYTKSNNSPLTDEVISRSISSYIKRSKQNRKNTYSVLQDIVIEYFRRDSSIDEFKRNNYSLSEYYSCKFPIEQNGNSAISRGNLTTEKNNQVSVDDEDFEFRNSPLTMFVEGIVSQALGPRMNIFKNSLFKDTRTAYTQNRLSEISSAPSSISMNSTNLGDMHFGNSTDYIISGSQFGRTPINNGNDTSLNNYEYSFGVKGIQVGKSAGIHNASNQISTSKACYISKKILIPGDVYGIKAKVNVDSQLSNYNVPEFDIKDANSYELSISFKEAPSAEADWIPIASYGLDDISSEMLFVDPLSSTAKLRFFPESTSIKIYENQKLLESSAFSLNKFDKSITIKNFNKSSTYLASYSLDKNNFSQDYIDISVLSNAIKVLGSGEQGREGEFFSGTGPENMVTIKNDPFIDHSKLKNGTYSLTYGTLPLSEYSGYSPVLVKFADGTYAINLTNYLKGSFEKTNFYNTSEVLFFQNGKNLIFNKSINQPFNVIYNYMNNYIRFRLIVRNNFPNYFSSGSVNNVIIKMKTKSPDINTQKLLQLG
jgi:hypothetical protein